MKKHIVLFFILACFSLKAQMEVSILSAPFSAITETKILFPIGLELATPNRWSLYAELGIPFGVDNNSEENEKTYSLRAQLRAYSHKITKSKFKFYLAFEIYHQPGFSTKQNGTYRNEASDIINYSSVDVGEVINNLSLKIGSKRISRRRFIFDWNIGLSFVQKTTRYYNVTQSSGTVFTSFFGFGTGVAGSSFSPTWGGNIRFGYVLR